MAFINGQMVPRINKTAWALRGVSVLLAGAGIIFLVMALNQYLETIYAPGMAALASAVLVLAGALMVEMLRSLLQHKTDTPSFAEQDNLKNNLHDLIQTISNELEDPVKENPKTAVILAALAGFFMANRGLRL